MVVNAVQITENDCKKVLQKYYKGNKPFTLVNFSLAPISDEVNGFLGEHLVLKINVGNGPNNELRFFAKTLQAEQEAIAEFVKTANMFNKEVFCYKFLEDVKKECPDFDASCAPKYYFSRSDEVIILEDLTENGYQLWNGPLDLDLEHIKLSLKATAKFHAASIILEEIKSLKMGRTYSLMEDYGQWLTESMYRKDETFLGFHYVRTGLRGLCALVDLLPKKNKGLGPSEFKAKMCALFDQVFEDIKPSQTFRNVWCNGDLWTKNVMFRYKNGLPVDCKIFDFQLQRYSPPAHDVLFMIYQTANRKMRQEHFDYFLDYYYDNLKDELAKAGLEIHNVLSRDEFDSSIKVIFPTVKLTKSIYKSLCAISKESLKLITDNPKMYGDITFRDRADFIVQEFKANNTYREIMTTLLEDLEDMLTHEIITIEDCYTILRNKLTTTKYELLDYTIMPIDEKTGFLGEHSQLKIKIRTENKEVMDLNYFVKSLPKDEGVKSYVTSSKLFFKEAKFYTKIIPEILGNNVDLITECFPKCYLARSNDVLVFDNYTFKGYTVISPRIFYDYEEVAIVVKKMAKLHASSFIMEEKLSTPALKYRLGDHYKEELCETHYGDSELSVGFMRGISTGILTHIDLFPDSSSKIDNELFKKRALKIYNEMIYQAKPSKKYRNVICHGDLWSNNILIKYEDNSPVDCVFVDLQNYRYNTPAHDLISFLYLVTDNKFRAQHMPETLKFYYSEMSKLLINHTIDINNVLPYDEFLESCNEMKHFAVAQSVSWFQQIILTSEQINDLYSDPEISKKHYFQDRGPFIAKICAKDGVYRERMRDCIHSLRVICEKLNDLD